jgi:hypothetical protein
MQKVGATSMRERGSICECDAGGARALPIDQRSHSFQQQQRCEMTLTLSGKGLHPLRPTLLAQQPTSCGAAETRGREEGNRKGLFGNLNDFCSFEKLFVSGFKIMFFYNQSSKRLQRNAELLELLSRALTCNLL